MSGVMTVEASIVLPIFILATMGFVSIIHIIYVQMCVQSSIDYAAMSIQSKGVVYEYIYSALDKKAEETQKKMQGLITGEVEVLNNELFKEAFGWVYKEVRKVCEKEAFEIVIREAVISHLKQLNTDYSCFTDGVEHIVFKNSTMDFKTGEFKIVADYELKIPILFSKRIKFKTSQSVSGRIFGGRISPLNIAHKDENDKETEKDIKVYITQWGEVYHKDKNCTYLTNRMHKARLKEVCNKRSNSGEIYYPCDRCAKIGGINPETEVYYSKEGARYHLSLHCPSVFRKVIETIESEVTNKRKCDKCG